ncbi:MAG: hypothetical protein OJF59_000666 [Cytophagales bacterium]|jgi:hypothetical protein|nr:MAG: hypothetical protein OJF59_000666 [Cytophagales bacterium]
MKKIIAAAVVGWAVTSCTPRLTENQALVENMMKQHPHQFKRILKDRDTLQVQIIYTQINRDSLNRAHFKSFYFNVDSTNYFYPASTVKLPQVLLAFEKLNQLQIRGLNEFTPMFNDSVYAGQFSVKKDSTSENGLPSVAHYAKKILIVSDNDAFNRLYEFVGQKETNERLKAKGYNMRVLHRLERPLTPDQNRHTEAVRFVRHDSLIYSQPMLINPDSIKPTRKVFKGIGYEKDGKIIHRPFNFTYKNFYPLQEQQEILKAVLFPEMINPKKRFNLTESQHQFVMKYMSQLPRETKYPAYQNDKNYIDAYCKFLMHGDGHGKIPDHIRIFNKVGDAYGYLLDNAYIVDFKNNIEFMLSAVINTNTDGIYNDSTYEYKELGYPFMKNLGKMVYKYELKRKRKQTPDLSNFRLHYDH